jgi:hypothetical protein
MCGREALAPLVVAVVGVGVVCVARGDGLLIWVMAMARIAVARTEPAHALAGVRDHGIFVEVAEVRGAWTWLGGAYAVVAVVDMALV